MRVQTPGPPGCPGCGFSYGWDGKACRHCGYPVSTDDGLPEKRILYMSRHARAAGRMHRFEQETPNYLKADVLQLTFEHIRGDPVLLLVNHPMRWTLLTTREVVCWEGEELRTIRIADIPFLADRGELPADATCEKSSTKSETLTYLRILDRYGSETSLWVPGHTEALALWDILHSYTRGGEAESGSGWL